MKEAILCEMREAILCEMREAIALPQITVNSYPIQTGRLIGCFKRVGLILK